MDEAEAGAGLVGRLAAEHLGLGKGLERGGLGPAERPIGLDQHQKAALRRLARGLVRQPCIAQLGPRGGIGGGARIIGRQQLGGGRFGPNRGLLLGRSETHRQRGQIALPQRPEVEHRLRQRAAVAGVGQPRAGGHQPRLEQGDLVAQAGQRFGCSGAGVPAFRRRGRARHGFGCAHLLDQAEMGLLGLGRGGEGFGLTFIDGNAVHGAILTIGRAGW